MSLQLFFFKFFQILPRYYTTPRSFFSKIFVPSCVLDNATISTKKIFLLNIVKKMINISPFSSIHWRKRNFPAFLFAGWVSVWPEFIFCLWNRNSLHKSLIVSWMLLSLGGRQRELHGTRLMNDCLMIFRKKAKRKFPSFFATLEGIFLKMVFFTAFEGAVEKLLTNVFRAFLVWLFGFGLVEMISLCKKGKENWKISPN